MEISNMQDEKVNLHILKIVCVLVLAMAMPVDAHAYVDPGTTGMLSQLLYILFYGALGMFLYMLRYIKQYLVNVRQFVARLLGRRP